MVEKTVKIANSWKDLAINIIVPQCALWHNENVSYDGVIIIPYYVASEVGLYLDLMIYGYIYSAINTWFGNITMYQSINWYFLMVSVLFISAIVSVVLKYKIQKGSTLFWERFK